ncbi:MAG: hypothetical protein U0360_05715 [Dehalococcoidia bacterium]
MTLPVQAWAGWRFFEGACGRWGRTIVRHEHADRPRDQRRLRCYSAAATLALQCSPAEGIGTPVYYDTSAAIIVVPRLLERAKGQDDESVRALIALRPKPARVLSRTARSSRSPPAVPEGHRDRAPGRADRGRRGARGRVGGR